MTIFSYIQEFLDSKQIKSNTQNLYKFTFKSFKEWWDKYKEDKNYIKEEDIFEYKYYLQMKGLNESYIAQKLSKIRIYLQYLEDKGIQKNPIKGIKISKSNKNHKRNALSIKQAKILLESIEITTLKGKRDYAIINLMIRTGLRSCEVRNINIEDIREGVLYILGKGRDTKDEFVVLTPETEKPIRDYLACLVKYKEIKNTDPLFLSLGSSAKGKKFDRLSLRHIHTIVKKRLNFIGIFDDRITPHSLRHTAVTLALQAGANILQVQAMARHKNIATTMIYAHNLNRIEDAAEKRIDKILCSVK